MLCSLRSVRSECMHPVIPTLDMIIFARMSNNQLQLQLQLARIFYIAFNVLCLTILSGCNRGLSSPNFSDNMAALQEIVELKIQATSARWEISTSPEQTGLQVGPTVATILISELIPEDKEDFSKLPVGEEWFYVTEADRAWVDQHFRALFKKKVGRSIDLSRASTCKPDQGKIRKSGKNVPGFTCISENKLLIY